MNSRSAWLCMSVGTSLVLALGPAARAQSPCDGVDIVVTGAVAVCTGGGAQYTADGGDPPYEFSLNDPGNTGSTISEGGSLHAGPNPGIVAVIAKDKHECEGAKDVAIVGVVITDPVGYWESCKGDTRLFVANGIPGGGEYSWEGGPWTSDPTTNILFDAASGPTNKIVCVRYRLAEADCGPTCTTGTVYSLEMGPNNFGACVDVPMPFVASGMPTGMSAYAWSPAGVTNTSPDGAVSTNWVTFNSYGYDQLVECTYGPCTKTVTGLVAQVTIDPADFWGACLSNVLVATGQPDPDGGYYSWSDGTSGRTNTVTNIGTNILTVTYNLGPATCTEVTTGIVAQVTIDPPSPWQSCGATNLVATGLPDPDGGSYVWSNGVTGRTNTVSGIGTNILSVTYTLGPATCSLVSTGVIYSLEIKPMSTNVCVNTTNTFVATGLPAGAASYVWTLRPGASGLPNPQQTNNVVFSTAGLNQPVKVDYGPCSVTATANVFEVQSVVWEAINSPLTNNAALGGPGGGVAMFPDKDDPADSLEHRTVKVLATINPKTNDFTVYFKVFDVDDSSSNTSPVDDNDSPNETGDDNRDDTVTAKGGELNQRMAPTDMNGVAEVVLTVSRQPGNNFRVAASCDTNSLAKLTVTNGIPNTLYVPASDAQVSGFHGTITEMLTVWRRLHVELDSMAPVTGNFRSGNVTEIRGATPNANELSVNSELRDGSPDLDDNAVANGFGRFENGQFTIGTGTGLPGATVTSNICCNGQFLVQKALGGGISIPCLITKTNAGLPVVSGRVWRRDAASPEFHIAVTGGTLTGQYKDGEFNVAGVMMEIKKVKPGQGIVEVKQLQDIPFVVHDDDDDTLFNSLLLPKAGLLPTALAATYVEPVFGVAGLANVNPVAPFVLNVSFDPAKTNDPDGVVGVQRWDSKGGNANDFWIAYSLACFQGTEFLGVSGGYYVGDRDPGLELPTGGFTAMVGGTLVFVEVHQAHEGVPNPLLQEQDTVVHEFGHAVGGPALPPGADPENPPAGVTDGVGSYRAEYLHYIRTSVRPRP